ncbi:hypothetical protein Q7M_1273 (plasmid) [Borrelia crocidurae str. Achema]|uniref:Uncharacterized protein n=1 Tax=Borrelia crocidurae (strain Achema) TaxID=1155096 RepID=I0FEX4_BORCA|nr:hypothetical protein Q7M_1273 [Borrelia crocidurae str. Achema]
MGTIYYNLFVELGMLSVDFILILFYHSHY